MAYNSEIENAVENAENFDSREYVRGLGEEISDNRTVRGEIRKILNQWNGSLHKIDLYDEVQENHPVTDKLKKQNVAIKNLAKEYRDILSNKEIDDETLYNKFFIGSKKNLDPFKNKKYAIKFISKFLKLEKMLICIQFNEYLDKNKFEQYLDALNDISISVLLVDHNENNTDFDYIKECFKRLTTLVEELNKTLPKDEYTEFIKNYDENIRKFGGRYAKEKVESDKSKEQAEGKKSERATKDNAKSIVNRYKKFSSTGGANKKPTLPDFVFNDPNGVTVDLNDVFYDLFKTNIGKENISQNKAVMDVGVTSRLNTSDKDSKKSDGTIYNKDSIKRNLRDTRETNDYLTNAATKRAYQLTLGGLVGDIWGKAFEMTVKKVPNAFEFLIEMLNNIKKPE